MASARRDGLHQLSTRLVAECDTVVVEDLPAAGMVGHRRLARAVSEVGMSELRCRFDCKTTWSGCDLVVADRGCSNSKTCHSCGAVKAGPRPPQRAF